MPISWNEIRHNAIQFSREWATETREEAEAKSFWDEFFQVFGIDYRYSTKLIYNNFPWPENPTAKQRLAIETSAQTVLDVRAKFLASGSAPASGAGFHALVETPSPTGAAALPSPLLGEGAQDNTRGARAPQTRPPAPQSSTLADLYDPLSMPPALVRAHADLDLDRAVDLAYRPQPFPSERARVEHLFALYEKLTAPLLLAIKTRKMRSG